MDWPFLPAAVRSVPLILDVGIRPGPQRLQYFPLYHADFAFGASSLLLLLFFGGGYRSETAGQMVLLQQEVQRLHTFQEDCDAEFDVLHQDLTNQIAAQDAQIGTFKAELRVKSREASQLARTVTELEQQCSASNRSAAEASQRRESLAQKDNAKLRKQLEKQTDTLQKLRATTDGLEKEARKIKQHEAKLVQCDERQKAQIAKLRAQVTQQSGQASEQVKRGLLQQREVHDVTSRHVEAGKLLEVSSIELQNARSELRKANAEKIIRERQQEKRIAELTTALHSELDAKEQALVEADDKLEQCAQAIQLEQELAAAQTEEMTTSQVHLKMCYEEIEELRAALAKSAEYDAVSKEKLEAQIDSESERAVEWKERCIILEKSTAKHRLELDTRQATLTATRADLSKVRFENEALNKRMAETALQHKDEAAKLQKESGKYKNKAAELTKDVDEHRIAAVKGATTKRLTKEVAQHKEDKAKLANEVLQCKEEIVKMAQEVAEHKEAAATLTERSKKHERQASLLAEELQQHEDENNKLLDLLASAKQEALKAARGEKQVTFEGDAPVPAPALEVGDEPSSVALQKKEREVEELKSKLQMFGYKVQKAMMDEAKFTTQIMEATKETTLEKTKVTKLRKELQEIKKRETVHTDTQTKLKRKIKVLETNVEHIKSRHSDYFVHGDTGAPAKRLCRTPSPS